MYALTVHFDHLGCFSVSTKNKRGGHVAGSGETMKRSFRAKDSLDFASSLSDVKAQDKAEPR